MKFIFLFCFVAFLSTSGAENDDNGHPQQEIFSQGSTYNQFAERIVHFYTTILAAIRDNYVEDPLNGVTYGSIESPGFLRLFNDTLQKYTYHNYTVAWNNITVWLTNIESQSYRIKYKCTTTDKLNMTVNRRQNGEIRFDSQLKIQSVEQESLVEGSHTTTWKILTINSYELNTKHSNTRYVVGSESSNTSVNTPMKLILVDAGNRSNYTLKLESFVQQTLVNDGSKKANGKIFADFSKTTCNELLDENNFRKITINDFQPPAENPANITVRYIVLESAHNFTDVSFSVLFHQLGFFIVKFGEMKIKYEYLQQDSIKTRTSEYFVKSFQTHVKIEQKTFPIMNVKDATVKYGEIDDEEVSFDDILIRRYVQTIIEQVLSKAIISHFNSTRLS